MLASGTLLAAQGYREIWKARFSVSVFRSLRQNVDGGKVCEICQRRWRLVRQFVRSRATVAPRWDSGASQNSATSGCRSSACCTMPL